MNRSGPRRIPCHTVRRFWSRRSVGADHRGRKPPNLLTIRSTVIAPERIRQRDSSSRRRRFPRVRVGSRTRVESRVPILEGDEDAEVIATPTRRFSVVEITSGLPDDSREADERAAERQLRELRARAKTARAVVATTLGLAEALQHDWQKAGRSYARFGATEARFRFGVPAGS
jgi:hypothetical protein